ncbi:MAG: hypothetical protein PHQ27_08885, partial [Victivallales bacterium]|nr:hypothetical protein [Victivallales bacterium]
EEGPDAITDKTRPSTIPATYHRPPATGTNVADGISGIAENHARHGHRSRETLPFRNEEQQLHRIETGIEDLRTEIGKVAAAVNWSAAGVTLGS